MCGLPASGKTTLANRLADEIPAIRLCTDEWQSASKWTSRKATITVKPSMACLKLSCGYMQKTSSGMVRASSLKGLLAAKRARREAHEARELGVDIELHYFEVPIDELVRRLEMRNSEGNPNVFSISREQIEEYFKSFEPPDEAELALFPVSIVHRAGS